MAEQLDNRSQRLRPGFRGSERRLYAIMPAHQGACAPAAHEEVECSIHCSRPQIGYADVVGERLTQLSRRRQCSGSAHGDARVARSTSRTLIRRLLLERRQSECQLALDRVHETQVDARCAKRIEAGQARADRLGQARRLALNHTADTPNAASVRERGTPYCVVSRVLP